MSDFKTIALSKFLFLIITVFCLQSIAHAQDVITRKNGEVLKVKIIEVGTSEVKYRNLGDESGPIYVLEKDRISKIKYESGREEKLVADSRDMERYKGQKNRAVKISFLSPLAGHTMVSYEHSPKLGQSFELSLAIIGVGKNRELDWGPDGIQEKNRDQAGVGVGIGYKFIKLPNFQYGNMRYTHIMQGSYAKPSFYLGSFKENMIMDKGNNQYVLERQNITFGALQLELGRQWVLGERFALDLYTGIGMGFDNRKETDPFFSSNDKSGSSYNYMASRVGYSPGFSFNGGIKIGYLF